MLVSTFALGIALQGARQAPPPIIFTTPPPPIMVAPPAPPPPPPLPPSGVFPARARANLASYVTADDYPAEAMRNEEQGLVAFRLYVGPDGRVVGCSVTSSSGSPSLDETTCSIMQRRARFTPAMMNGRPANDTVAARIRWQFAPEPEAAAEDGQPVIVQRARPVRPLASLLTHADFPAQARGQNAMTSRFRLGVGADGRVVDCEIDQPGTPDLDAAACRLMRARARFTPARDSAGNAVADDHWGHIHWRSFSVAPVPAPPPPR